MGFWRMLAESAAIALHSLRGHRFRSLLTMMGISIGIFAITIVFTFVNSLEYSISKNLSELGNTVIFIHNWPWRDASDDWYKFFNRPKVSYNEYVSLQNQLTEASTISFSVNLESQVVKYEGKSLENVSVSGITYDELEMRGLNIIKGRYFTDIESESGRPVTVIGMTVAQGLGIRFPGEYIRVGGKKVRVLGILEPKGTSIFGESEDNKILLPYLFVERNFNTRRRSVDKLITVKGTTYERLPMLESEITGIMRKLRGLKPETEDNFSLNKQEMLMTQLDNIFYYVQVVGIMISIFSVIVGGIGIGNMMFTSVKQRTFEIGVQKALGATQQFILLQFLLESVFLCIVGGLIGIGLTVSIGAITSFLLAQNDVSMEIVFSLNSMVAGVLISVVIGLLAGMLPATIAARLDPVESMRQ